MSSRRPIFSDESSGENYEVQQSRQHNYSSGAHKNKQHVDSTRGVAPVRSDSENDDDNSVEEGELPPMGGDKNSGGIEDGLYDDMIKDAEDKKRLLNMPETKREVEIYNRFLQKSHESRFREVEKKIQEQKNENRRLNFLNDDDEDENDDDNDVGVGKIGMRRHDKQAQRKSGNADSFDNSGIKRKISHSKKSKKKHSRLVNDSNRLEEVSSSLSSMSSTDDEKKFSSGNIKESNREMGVLLNRERRKTGKNNLDEQFQKLKEITEQKAARQNLLQQQKQQNEHVIKRHNIYSDNEDDDDESDTNANVERGVGNSSASHQQQNRVRNRTYSSSSSSSEDQNSQHVERESRFITNLDQLLKMQLCRDKLAKWVHMPFFSQLVKGCFVRVNIGVNQKSADPIYRCAEIIETVETGKIYDVGDTRTNAGLLLRIGNSRTTFRLAFISNQRITQAEFESYMRHTRESQMDPPTLANLRHKQLEIDQAARFQLDNKTLDQILASKRRFKQGPTNHALRKAELFKLKEAAEAEGNLDAVQNYQDEIDEIDQNTEKSERKRTQEVKSIQLINQRNREANLNRMDEAEDEEDRLAMEQIGGDPFDREHTAPTLISKKNLQKIREKRQRDAEAAAAAKQTEEAVISSATAAATGSFSNSNTNRSVAATPSLLTPSSSAALRPSLTAPLAGSQLHSSGSGQTSLHDIHNFDINISIDEIASVPGGAGGLFPGNNSFCAPLGSTGNESKLVGANSAIQNCSGKQEISSGELVPRRSMNLEEYKRMRGLI